MKVNYSKFPFFQVNSLQFLKEHTKFNMLHLIITHFSYYLFILCVKSTLFSNGTKWGSLSWAKLCGQDKMWTRSPWSSRLNASIVYPK